MRSFTPEVILGLPLRKIRKKLEEKGHSPPKVFILILGKIAGGEHPRKTTHYEEIQEIIREIAEEEKAEGRHR